MKKPLGIILLLIVATCVSISTVSIQAQGVDAAPGTLLKRYSLPVKFVGMTMIGDDLWAVSGSSLYEFDLTSGLILNTVTHGYASPYGLGYDTRRKEFVLTAAGAGTVGRVDMTGKVTTIFPSPTNRPIGVAYDPNRDAYWVADWSNNVLHLMDATAGTTIQPSFSLTPSGCTRSADVGYSPFNDLLVIIGLDKNQAFLYTAGNPPVFRQAVTFSVSIPGGARGAHFHPRTQTLLTDSFSTPYEAYIFDLGLPRVDAASTVAVGSALKITWTAGSSPSLFYQAGASFTEWAIGMPFGTRYFPMALDDLFFLSLAVPSIFNNFNGILDPSGTAVGSVNVPNAPVLAGIFFSVAFVTASPTAPKGIQDISGPWKITITK